MATPAERLYDVHKSMPPNGVLKKSRPIQYDHVFSAIADGTAQVIGKLGIDDVQDILHEVTGTELSDRLTEQFALDHRHWTFLHSPDSGDLPYVFVGHTMLDTELVGALVTNPKFLYDSADSTVFISRHFNTGYKTVFVNSVSIAGVLEDSSGKKRAVAVAYNPETQNATDIAVSVSIDELNNPSQKKLVNGYDKREHYGLREFPTSLDYPHYTPGLVTLAMVHDTAAQGSSHRYAVSRRDSSLKGPRLALDYESDYDGYTGFSGRHRIFRGEQQLVFKAHNQQLQSWELSLPAKLHK